MGSVHAPKQLEITNRGEPELRFTIPHKGIIENQKKSMPRETEKREHIHLMIGGRQTSGPSPGERDQKNLKEVWEHSLKDGHGVMNFCFDFF